jgi:hypothetical protein
MCRRLLPAKHEQAPFQHSDCTSGLAYAVLQIAYIPNVDRYSHLKPYRDKTIFRNLMLLPLLVFFSMSILVGSRNAV